MARTELEMGWKDLRNALSVESVQERHECALTLSLEPELAEFVVDLRRSLGRDELANRQLDPHITVLYCGFNEPPAIAALAKIAECFRTRRVKFSILDIGVFYNRAGLLTNIHYKLDSPELHVLHVEALEAYKHAGFQFQTPHVGEAYTPHISIFDRLAMPKTIQMLVNLPPKLVGHYAGNCHLIGELDTRTR